MPTDKMHDDEIEVPASLVQQLLSSQFPRWAHLPLQRVRSMGTVHAMYRLGGDMAVRLPMIPREHSLDKELRWLPWLAPRLPLAIPEPLAEGTPDHGYLWRWAIFRWIDGETWARESRRRSLRGRRASRRVLARAPAARSGRRSSSERRTRGTSLSFRDERVRHAIASTHGMLDTAALTTAWETALDVPEWESEPRWLHGDVLGGNVLTAGGRLRAIIDWGSAAVGDPACDLMAAWSLFSGESRTRFQNAMAADDATWARARGWAINRVVNVWQYANSNPRFVTDARDTIENVLADR